jgi:hypothetical protein
MTLTLRKTALAAVLAAGAAASFPHVASASFGNANIGPQTICHYVLDGSAKCKIVDANGMLLAKYTVPAPR